MKTRTFRANTTILLAVGALLCGCSTPQPAATVSAGQTRSSQALEDHQRRQAIRAREGGYERLYRPRVCRSNVGPCAR
ncbi:MAG: hypothetical protein ABW055_03045 [Pararhizobium sp.]